jgi:hypothetical protein
MSDNDSDLDGLIRRSTDVDVPADLEMRMQRRLVEFRNSVEARRSNRLRAWVDSVVHPTSFRLPAAAAVAVAAVVIVMVFWTGGSDAGRVYAAAATQFRNARSLQYTIALAPFVEVEFSFLAPEHRRVSSSWGVEVRTDRSGRELILMHGAKSYLIEEGKPVDSLASSSDLVEQLRSLPANMEEMIGERWVGNRKLFGYRTRRAPAGSAIPNLEALELWVDARTGSPEHVDITIAEPGKPLYTMHIKDIRVDSGIDRSVFDMAPPPDYTSMRAAIAERHTVQPGADPKTLRAEIKQAGGQTAVVVPMKGSYLQARAAVVAVESHLRAIGVTPAGPPFGRFESEQRWDAGYPVPPGTRVEAPFELVTLPAGPVASLVVSGPWGQDSANRWANMFGWVVEHGYMPAGPPIEIWSGEDGQPQTQSTEMRIAVANVK